MPDSLATDELLSPVKAPLLRITLREAAPIRLTPEEVFGGGVEGHAMLGGGTFCRRRTPFALFGPEEEAGRLERLRVICADTSLQTAPLVMVQLHHVDVDLQLGLCVTRNGLLLDETAFVASKIDPSLDSSPLLAVGASGNNPTRVPIAEPVLHCFHRSSAAYGHFVLDGLVTLEWARDYLLAVGGKVLVPPHMPPWAMDSIRALGFPAESILQPHGDTVRCHTLIVSSSIDTSTTFRADLALCSRLRQTLAGSVAGGRRIYLSRANQTSYSDRRIVNEEAVRDLLVARGFEVLEPGNMTIQAQAAALSGAAVVVGAHGSAFGNLVFAPPRTVVVDLMPADWVGYWDVDPPAERWLLNLTTALELDYRLLLCESRLTRLLPDEDRSGWQKFGMESEVDLGLLEEVLDGVASPAPVDRAVTLSPSPGTTPRPDDTLSILAQAALEPLFRLPDRRGTFSAWWGHAPFAAWLVRAAQPRSIVELGSFAGVSYFAFCQAVLADGVECVCHAVDTWQGDVHSGRYDNSLYTDFKRFNDARYASISTMHRCTFDEAVWQFADGTVDILHIDGLHTYDAVRHDFETWLSKMSDRGIVLFHDAVERRADFGVWQLWEELSARYPAFLFTHSHGLGVLAVGPNAPRAILDLCSSDAVQASVLRERIGQIGDSWYYEAHWNFAAMLMPPAPAPAPAPAPVQVEPAPVSHVPAEPPSDAMMELAAVQARLHAIEGSTIWRSTAVIRSTVGRFPWFTRIVRRAAKLTYWTASGQLVARLADRRVMLAAANGFPAIDDDPVADDGAKAPPYRQNGSSLVGDDFTIHVEHDCIVGDCAQAPAGDAADYRDWILRYDTLRDSDRDAIRFHISGMVNPPLISVVLRLEEAPDPLLRDVIASVAAQLWPRWELCILASCSVSEPVARLLTEAALDARIRVLRDDPDGQASSWVTQVLQFSSGTVVAFVDAEAQLAEHALYHIAAEFERDPDLDLVYGDSDSIDDAGNRYDPYFKPDFDPDLLLVQDFLKPIVAYSRQLIVRNRLPSEFDDSTGHGLALRLTGTIDPTRIRHSPAILAHARQEGTLPSAVRVARRAAASHCAVQQHLTVSAPGAIVEQNPLMPHRLRIRWPVPDPPPTVSVIIATRDRVELLARCLNGVLKRTDYAPIEVIIVDNASEASSTHALFERLQAEDARVRVISAPGPFNFAALNNLGARAARGQVFLLLNNDIEVSGRGWLRELVSHAVRHDVGAVGAKLHYADGTIQHAGVVLGIGGNVASHFHYGAPRMHPGYFGSLTLAHSVSAVTGACIAVRREVFEAVGGLDEKNLSVGYNDVDFCLRIRERGLRIVWTPFAELYHLESASRGADISSDQAERLRRETEYMHKRWDTVLVADPYYNANVSLARNDYGVGPQPRWKRPWERRSARAPASAHS